MDRFVNRLPTWQAKTYSQAMIAATRKNDKEKTSRRSMSQPLPSQQPLSMLQPTASVNNARNRRLTITSEDLMKILTEPLSPMVGGDGSVHDDDSGLSSTSSNTADQFGLDDPVEPGGNEENINPGLKRHNIAGDLSEYVNGTTAYSKLKVSHTKTTSSIPLEAVRSETELATNATSPRKPSTPLKKLPQLVATASAAVPVNYPSPQSVSVLKSNTMMAHIQRDLNSPSATVRLRAMKALKSPTKSAYAIFDVSHTEQQIITSQDRQVPTEPLSLEELMRNIVVYVEIRSGEDNRSAGVKKVISAMGARVNDKLLRNTTHVIFKDGLLSTYKKAKELNIPIVSILWIEACKNQRHICDPAKYPIANIDRYENPELYDKMKRVKSMQPDSELNKRVRAKPATPKASDTPTAAKKRSPKATTATTGSTPARATTPTTSKVKKTGITKFFKKVTTPSTPEQATKAAPVAESPATQVLNRLLASKETTPYRAAYRRPAKDSIDEQIEEDDSAPLQVYEYVVAPPEQHSQQQQVTSSELDLVAAAVSREAAAPATDELLAEQASAGVPKRRMSMRRRSMIAETSVAPPPAKPEETASEPQVGGSVKRRRSSTLGNMPVPVASANDVCPPATPKRQTRRRSLCSMPAASKAPEEVAVFKPIAEEESTETETEQTVREILSAVPLLPSSSGSLGEETAQRRRTTFTAEPMAAEMGEGEESRRTIYTPLEMEESVMDVSSSKGHATYGYITKAASDVVLRRAEEGADSPRNRLPRRETIYTPHQIDEDRLAGGGPVRTPQPAYSTLLEEHANMAVFDSTRVPGKRRTLFDVSMDIISRRVETINQKRRQSMVPAAAAVGDELLGMPTTPSTVTLVGEQAGDSSTPLQATDKAAGKPQTNGSDGGGAAETPEPRPKKRKLFTPNDSNLMTPTSSCSGAAAANNQSLATTPQSAVAKRRTLMPLMQPQSASKAQKPLTSSAAKPSATQRRRSTMDFEMIGKLSKPAAAGENRSRKERPLIVCTNMRKEQIDVIQEALIKLGGFQLEHYVNATTTHVVSLEPRRTLNMLLGLVRGLWILDYSWIVDSLKAHRWLNEEPYELKEFSRAVEICRAERQAFGNSYKCELFRHLGPFYISHRCGTVPKHDLKELILLCCGRVAETRKKAKYILGDVIRRFDDKVYITPFWVLDSITQMQLQKFSLYYCFADDGDANQGSEWKAPVEVFQR